MGRQLTKIFSGVMMVIFLAGIAPKQYLHDLLFDHHDTVHPYAKKGELVISGKHTHCSFVGFAFGPFVSSQKIFLTFRPQLIHATYFAASCSSGYHCLQYAPGLRGPPYGC